ncbi:ead/Ea22-like family protein [Escherichia coli]|uniref:ead/Ea22-like family protein n=1 Tax=Escherichia coli TaxID=562 RepID=UPI002A4E1473|nr:ead/Ea22-like family protein [Escherichia coli]
MWRKGGNQRARLTIRHCVKRQRKQRGVWSLEYGESRFDGDDALIHREVVGYLPICRIEGAHPESGFDEDFQMEQQANAEFIAAANPATVLALLDELERNQQYIKRRDQENEDIALTVGKLRVELEAAEKRIAELEAEPVSQTYKLTFEQWLEQQHDKIDVDCGCVSTEMLMHWIRVAYEAGNYPVTPDGWISCSERMPDKLIPVMVMYEDGEMWSAMWNGNRWDDGTEYPDPHSVTHWREMPAAPQQEVK